MTEQLILDLARAEAPTFANFVAGQNREALAALAAMASGRSHENGVLAWGAPGAGKSHLLQAALDAALPLRPVVPCAAGRGVPDAAGVPPSALVVIDRIDAADAEGQARLFTLLNTLAATGGQWIAAASAPPARLALRDDLRTRLALGLVFEIVPLADAEKPQALATYARERGFRLSDDVIAYLLAHGRRDMPSLVATLAALDRHSLATQRNVTVPLLREWLQRESGLSG
jgi:DnaA family protein